MCGGKKRRAFPATHVFRINIRRRRRPLPRPSMYFDYETAGSNGGPSWRNSIIQPDFIYRFFRVGYHTRTLHSRARGRRRVLRPRGFVVNYERSRVFVVHRRHTMSRVRNNKTSYPPKTTSCMRAIRREVNGADIKTGQSEWTGRRSESKTGSFTTCMSVR